MALDQKYCDMLEGLYMKVKPLVLINTGLLLSPLNILITTLDEINDSLLDNIDTALDTITIPSTDSDNLLGTLLDALSSCPALELIFPQSLIDQLQGGEVAGAIKLPNKFLNDVKSFIKDSVLESIETALDPFLNAACIALYKYDKLINKLKLPEFLDKLNQLETCLVAHCGTIEEGEKIHSSLLSTYKLTSSYAVDITTIALDAGLTPTSLFSAYASYKSKIEI